ncbi:hypothetical protein [Xanthomonas graminis]|uniref:hypothetical protein n=1 Tax=Xanthomonas graminis TaxID=3390026 RepID=UPI00083B8D9D|nr:hypothetical protein [Xanthomonas translucens]
MLPIILQLDSAAARHHRATLTPQSLTGALADALPQALTYVDAGIAQSVMVACGDMTELQAHQVLTLQIATLERFLDVQDAAND